MTSIERRILPATSPAGRGLLRALGQVLRRQSRQRPSPVPLSHDDSRSLRAFGLDPHDVADAMNDRRPSLLFYPLGGWREG